jgi:serine/threonine protein kinase
MIGTKLAHYEITSHIGSGGMGEVYQATDSKLGRSVAIKLLPTAFASDPERLSRFQREAHVLASFYAIGDVRFISRRAPNGNLLYRNANPHAHLPTSKFLGLYSTGYHRN